MNDNPAVHPDCILDRTGALNLVLIGLFISISAYVYETGAIRTVAVSVINVTFAIRALLGFEGWGFVFHWVI